MALLALGTLYAGGLGNNSAAALAEGTQVHLAAKSGIRIAYQALTADQSYSGENCTPLENSSCSVDITVTDLGESEYEVYSHATQGDADCLIRTKACLRPFGLYPLTVGRNVNLKGNSRILGDCYLEGYLWGKDESEITGNVYLTGERDITYNADGDPVTIGGYPAPKIGGGGYLQRPALRHP